MLNDILTPVNAAKAMWLVLLVHGTLHALAPDPTSKKYHVPDHEHGLYNVSIRGIGTSLLFTCAMVACLVVFPCDNDDAPTKVRYQAYALAMSAWFVYHLGKVLNKETSKKGGSDVPNIVLTVLNAVLIYGFLHEDWAPMAACAGVTTLFAFGLGMSFFTKFLFGTIWRFDAECIQASPHGPHLFFLARACGMAMTQSGVLVAALEWGNVEPVRAFGYSCGVLLLGLVGLPLVSSSSKDVDRSLSARHLAMAVGCAMAMFLMLRSSDGGGEGVISEKAE